MSENKSYYYIRLKDKFFDDDKITLLESMSDGILYTNILLKMYLKSIKFNGILRLTDEIAYTSEMIATITRHQVGTVEKALHMFQQLGLIEMLTDGAYYMTNIQELIGKSSTEGDRKRAARNSLQEQGLLGGQMSDKRPPEYRVKSLDINSPLIPPQGETEDLQASESLVIKRDTGTELSVDHSMTLIESFELFWQTYPNKKARRAAEKAWNKLNPTPELVQSVLAAVEQQKHSCQWLKENGQYIPEPANWLNKNRWMDESHTSTQKRPASYDLTEIERRINSGFY